MLPVFVLAFPFKFFLFGFNIGSFLIIDKVVASIYVWFYPQITLLWGELEPEDLLNSFKIKPKRTMSSLPFLLFKEGLGAKSVFIVFILFLVGLWCSIPFLLWGSGEAYF